MKFDQMMEKIDIEYSGSKYEQLFFNIDEENKIQYRNGNKYWFLNGKRHREDGPAIEWASGNKHWYLNGEYHRADGPAIERSGGDKSWWLHGNCHRADGPAIEYSNGSKCWLLHGKEYSEEKYNEKVKRYR